MAGFVLLSDDYWLLGPSFATYIDTDLKPDAVDIDNLRPEPLSAANMRPKSGTAITDPAASENRPRSTTTTELKPSGSVSILKPRSTSIEES